ncbi:hypothetical protein Ddye_012168 [Dipteronia dyeriana]|uniref:Uncharacterized protein n=1 Tax=Dipteronia dyeriana TaxID=168575 RepID=A0AAD9X407_9ROSI|nr:hypothetical protein Ddye_012168 [Dipteronia dyeriana]
MGATLTLMRRRLKDFLKTLEGDWFKGKLTRHDHFEALTRIDDALNRVPEDFVVDDRRRFMASCFRHFMSMHREMKFSGGVIHRLLLRELDHEGQQMRCGCLENDIHQRYFSRADEVSLEELRVVLTLGEFQEAYDAVNLCLIYMPKWILMGVDERFKILVWQFWLVEDLTAFDAFPLGAHVYRHSILSFKHVLSWRREERREQSQGDVVHTVEGLGVEFGTGRVTEISPHERVWKRRERGRRHSDTEASDPSGPGFSAMDTDGSELSSWPYGKIISTSYVKPSGRVRMIDSCSTRSCWI